MIDTPGRLLIDGEEVPSTVLAEVTGQVLRAAATLPPGSLISAGGDVLGVLAARLAAAELGLTVLLGPTASGGAGLGAALEVTKAGAAVISQQPAGGGAAISEETALVIPTSGSSGHPKLAQLSRRGLAYQAGALRERLSLDDHDLMLLPIPVTHAYGFSVVETWIRYGAGLAVESSFNARRVLAMIGEHPVTTLDTVPSMIDALLRREQGQPGAAALLGGLRCCNVGGDVLPADLARRFLEATHKPLLDGYGLTEAGPNVAVNAPDDWRPGTVGRPLVGTEVRISETGEVLTRSPSTFLGYVADSAASAAMLDDGWLRTGDLGEVDQDGYLCIHGRTKDVIIVHGASTAPSVIEDALSTAAGVLDVGVVPTRKRGSFSDSIVAFVSMDSSSSPAAVVTAVREAGREGLPPHLRPVEIRVLDSIPRTPSGKVDRASLRGSLAL